VSLSKGDADFLRDHQGLFSYKGVTNPDKKEMIYAITLFGQTQLSIVDCILCARAINSKMPLFTPLEIMPRSVSSPAIAGLKFLTGFTFGDELKKFCSNTPHKK